MLLRTCPGFVGRICARHQNTDGGSRVVGDGGLFNPKLTAHREDTAIAMASEIDETASSSKQQNIA